MSDKLDAKIAIKVMGWLPSLSHQGFAKPCWVKFNSQAGPDGGYVVRAPKSWSPSTRLDHAMQVVEKFRKKATQRAIISIGGRYCWKIAGVGAIEDTLPLAICKAALKFLEEQSRGIMEAPDIICRRKQ